MNSTKSLSQILITIFFSFYLCLNPVFSMLEEESSDEKPFLARRPFAILAVEEGENSVAFYNSETGKETHRLYLGYYPHEVAVSPDGKWAFVSNFGIRDYNYREGNPGNCISVIDLKNFCEVRRLYTKAKDAVFWGPHGLKLHPNGKDLYVNVECVGERYPKSNAPQVSKMLVFDISSGNISKFIPTPFSSPSRNPQQSFPLLSGAHNFIFASSQPTNQKQEVSEEEVDLWYYAGPNGVACINPKDGSLKKYYSTKEDPTHSDSKAFNGAVRGLATHPEGHYILAAARNEISLIPLSGTENGPLLKFGDLGVGQVFYAMVVPGTHLALAPAAREGHVLVVDIDPNSLRQGRERVIQRLCTGVDPLQVIMSPREGENVVFVTNPNSSYISELVFNLNDPEPFSERRRIRTGGGVNGIGFSPFTQLPEERFLTLGACIPLSGEFAPEGRECRIGLQFWEEAVNRAGGFVVNDLRYFIKIIFGNTESETDNNTLKDIFGRFIKQHEGIVSMFGTYPSSANEPLARALSSSSIPLITATGRDPRLFEKEFNVFGLAPLQESSDLIGAFQAVYKHSFPRPQTAMIITCDDGESCQEAESLEKYLIQNGMTILNPFIADSLNSSSIIAIPHAPAYKESEALHKMKQRMIGLAEAARKNCRFNPDLLFVLGHRRESAVILNQLANEKFSYKGLIINAGISHYHFLTQVTAPVENAMGSVTWCKSSVDFAEDRFVASPDFFRMFYERYSEFASDLVAGAAASGIVFEAAMKQDPHHSLNKGFDFANLLDGLRMLHFTSFYGPINFDERGVNTEKSPIVVQLKDRATSNPIWPESTIGWEKPKFPM